MYCLEISLKSFVFTQHSNVTNVTNKHLLTVVEVYKR